MPSAAATSRPRILIARILAVVGTIAIGIPIVAPLALMLMLALLGGGLHLDYLMPGELFLVALLGGAVLFAGAIVAGRRRWLIGALWLVAALMFGLTTWTAAATGLASGATGAAGWPLAIVIGSYALYVAAVIAALVAGIVLFRDLFRRGSAGA